MILIVGASGRLGGAITHRLLEMGKAVRILTRENPAYRPYVDAGAQPVTGDLKDRLSLDAACRGVDTVINTATAAERGGPDSIESVDRGGASNLIEAARAAGVNRFIYISATGAGPNHPVPFFSAKGHNEQQLRGSGMVYTILSPHFYMDVWLGVSVGIPLRAGQPVTLVGKGDHKHSFIAIQDVAAFAVAALDNPKARNEQLLLGGPEAISTLEIVNRVGKVLGRELPVNFVPPGAPIPLLPESAWGFLYSLESFELSIDMHGLPETYGVRLTPVEEVARQMFAAP